MTSVDQTQEKTTGREPETRLVKSIKAVILAQEAFDEVDAELKKTMNLENAKSPSERDLAVIENSTVRFDLNRELEPMLVKIFPLSRIKDKTDEQEAELILLQTNRDKIHARLYSMPALGMAPGEESKAKKKKFHGRPPISLEMKHIRAENELNKEITKFNILSSKGAGAVQIVEILGKKINNPTVKHLMKVRDKFFSGKTVGRFSGGNVTKLERDLRLVRNKIAHIESGEEQKERDEKEKGRTTMGRPFESLDVKLEKLQAKEQQILDNINEEEKNMSPLDLSHRKIVLLRKEIKAQKVVLESEGIDEILDKEHPMAIEYNRLNYVLARITQRRSVLAKENEYITELNAKPSKKKAVSKTTLNKDEVAKAKAKQEKIEKAKLIKEKKEKAIQLKKSKGVDQSETDALKSIVG